MHKKTKIFITLFFIFIFSLSIPAIYAKYVIEDINIVAKIDIDRCKPNITLIDITSSNVGYPNYANRTHTITGHIKITEKNIIQNHLSTNNIKIAVGNPNSISESNYILPEFKSFFLISESATEKIYEFSFTNTINNGNLVLIIPEGVVEDKSRFNQ